MHPNQSSSSNEVNSSTPILFTVLNHCMVQLPVVFLIMLQLVYNVVPRKYVWDIFLSYCKSMYCSLDLGLSHFGKNLLMYRLSLHNCLFFYLSSNHWPITHYWSPVSIYLFIIYCLLSLSSVSIVCVIHLFACVCVWHERVSAGMHTHVYPSMECQGLCQAFSSIHLSFWDRVSH